MNNRRYFTHIGSLCLSKTADGLIDPKLVLPWLMNALGAPGFLTGLLVPVREAGALLPQLLLARQIERRSIRRYFWVVGSAVQGVAALGIAASALLLSGQAAGWAIILCLAVLAVARSACSASYKDVLARTIDKGSRGRVSGTAGTFSAIVVFAFAVLLSTEVLPREPFYIACAVAVAGGLWLLGAGLFATLDEPPADSDGAAMDKVADLVRPLKEDSEFRTYVATRALLISTALAPPFLVMLGSTDEVGFGNLGLLILASSVAVIVSSYLWGALSDKSSRRVLMLAGLISAITLGVAATIGFGFGGVSSGYVNAGFVFIAQIAYEGARAGRKTHLTDMDTDDQKSVYTALSNSLIGVLLLAGGALGLVSDTAGPQGALAILAVLSTVSVFTARNLSEVQAD